MFLNPNLGAKDPRTSCCSEKKLIESMTLRVLHTSEFRTHALPMNPQRLLRKQQ